MTTKRVIPRWTKRRDHAPIVLQQRAHDAQYLTRIVEMLERIERQDHVRFFIRARSERTSIRNSTLGRGCTRIREGTLANGGAGRGRGAARRGGGRGRPGAAAE